MEKHYFIPANPRPKCLKEETYRASKLLKISKKETIALYKDVWSAICEGIVKEQESFSATKQPKKA